MLVCFMWNATLKQLVETLICILDSSPFSKKLDSCVVFEEHRRYTSSPEVGRNVCLPS